MVISSPLSPGVISPQRPSRITAESAQNFISGGSPLGTSVVTSAANKIVGFQRGASAVAPRATDLGSIIKTLSSSILTNVENRVQSINQNVSQFVSQRVQKLGDSFQQRVQTIDDARPNKILREFLSLYENAIDYVKFLASPKNVKNLGDNLRALQSVFDESFQVAIQIRKTIIRLVNQLASLPTASSGGSGLNIDLKVPGGPLKRTAPRNMRGGGRRGFGMLPMLGAGLIGAGGGALATSALAKVGQDVEGQQTQTDLGLSGEVIDKFDRVLNLFDSILRGFQTPTETKSGSAPSVALPPTGDEDKDKDSSSTAGGDVSSIVPGSEEELRLAAAISTEAAAGQSATDVLQVLANRKSQNPNKSYDDLLTAPIQFEGVSMKRDPVAFRKIKTLEDASAWSGKSIEDLKKYIAALRDPTLRENSARDLKGAVQFRAQPGYYREKGLVPGEMGDDGRFYNSFWRGGLGDNQFFVNPGDMGALKAAAPVNYEGLKSTAAPASSSVEPQKKSMVAAGDTRSLEQQEVAQQVSQPVVITQGSPSLNVINSGGQSQPQQTMAAEPQQADPKPMPMYSSSNADNFLTLYTRLVYNIVDG